MSDWQTVYGEEFGDRIRVSDTRVEVQIATRPGFRLGSRAAREFAAEHGHPVIGYGDRKLGYGGNVYTFDRVRPFEAPIGRTQIFAKGGYKDEAAAIRKVGNLVGVEGREGGWIYPQGADRPITQGWAAWARWNMPSKYKVHYWQLRYYVTERTEA